MAHAFRSLLFRTSLLLFLLCAGPGWAGDLAPDARSGSDWPRFLGPDGTGISSETGLLDRWPAEGPPRIWSREIGTGYSAPSVRDGLLVIHHRLKREEIVEALEAATGKPLWRHAYPSDYRDPYGYNSGPRCTPLLTSNRCYTFGAEGRLVCLDLKTGKLVWERDTVKMWTIPDAFFGVGSTPLLDGNRLIVMVGGQPNSGVVALDPETGETLWENVGQSNWDGVEVRGTGWPEGVKVPWKTYWKQASYASPVVATIHGRRHLFNLMRPGLVSQDPETGAVDFSLWFRARANDSVNAACPVVIDDLVFISAAYYKQGSVLLRVKPDRSFEEVWRSDVLEIHWSTPIYHDGHLYAFSGRNEPDARFRCIEFRTGKLLWDRNESWPAHSTPQPDVYGRGSLILADNKLIVLGEGGLLGLFALNPDKPEELSRFQVPDFHYPSWAAPVLARQRMYLRSEDRLVCYDLKRQN